MSDERVQEQPRVVLTDAPAARLEDERCPSCGAGKERRGPSAGFGTPRPICRTCGYEFPGVWRG